MKVLINFAITLIHCFRVPLIQRAVFYSQMLLGELLNLFEDAKNTRELTTTKIFYQQIKFRRFWRKKKSADVTATVFERPG